VKNKKHMSKSMSLEELKLLNRNKANNAKNNIERACHALVFT